MVKFWKDHSLTVILIGIGFVFFAIALPLREGTWFDTFLGMGHGTWTAALLNLLAGRFKERNKPEKD